MWRIDFRKTYHAIPEQFDKWRPRYCNELFDDVIEYAKIDDSKSVLEIGPGTGQATEPFLKTGCDYLAIELRENFVDFTKNKNYGFIDYNYRDWKSTRAYNADEYVEYLASTQVGHITLQESYKSNFYNGIGETIKSAGNKIILIGIEGIKIWKIIMKK